MEWWTKVRLGVLRGRRKKREVLRSEGIGWDTLKKILAHPEPPGYRLQEVRPKPKIGSYLERIAQIIEEDKSLPKKQRHTAKRLYERIREMGYEGKYTQVKDAVRELLRVKQEVFMPLIHRPGEAQVDFGYALAKVSKNLTHFGGVYLLHLFFKRIELRHHLYRNIKFAQRNNRYTAAEEMLALIYPISLGLGR